MPEAPEGTQEIPRQPTVKGRLSRATLGPRKLTAAVAATLALLSVSQSQLIPQ